MAEWLGRALQKLPQRFESAFDLYFSLFLISGSSSVGRAQPCQGWGRGFESRLPLCFHSVIFSVISASARVVESVDTQDLKSCGRNSPCGFESRPEHINNVVLFFLNAEVAQLVEHNLAKVGVAGSSLVFRSFFPHHLIYLQKIAL
jgi:hypothetical protein